MEKDIICVFTELLGQLRILHWQTEIYARHMAYGRAYDALEELADSFVEVYQGKYKRVKLSCQPNFGNISDPELNEFIDKHVCYLTKELYLGSGDVDLLAIRDEMVKELNQLKYLLTLK